MKPKQFEVKLSVNVLRDQRTKQFVVHSPGLDLSSCGKTESQALKNFQEAVQLFLSELERMGTMEDVLTELGWRKAARSSPGFGWVPPEVLHQKSIPVRIPAHA